jgi:hypothetical protein
VTISFLRGISDRVPQRVLLAGYGSAAVRLRFGFGFERCVKPRVAARPLFASPRDDARPAPRSRLRPQAYSARSRL